jgi:hypothetical protein
MVYVRDGEAKNVLYLQARPCGLVHMCTSAPRVLQLLSRFPAHTRSHGFSVAFVLQSCIHM